MKHIKSSREYILYVNACYDYASQSIGVLETNVNYHFSFIEKSVNFDPNEQKTKQIQTQGHKEKASTKHGLDRITQNPN